MCLKQSSTSKTTPKPKTRKITLKQPQKNFSYKPLKTSLLKPYVKLNQNKGKKIVVRIKMSCKFAPANRNIRKLATFIEEL